MGLPSRRLAGAAGVLLAMACLVGRLAARRGGTQHAAAAATTTARPRPANATKPRVAVIMRGLHEPQSACTGVRLCSTWRASLPAQAELLFAPLANLGCVVDICVEIKISRRVRASTSTPSTQRLLDGVAMPVPRHSTEPERPRHCREMT